MKKIIFFVIFVVLSGFQSANASRPEVEIGFGHYLVLKQDGTVWGWGENQQGQLGDDSGIDQNEPVQAKNLTDIVDIATSTISSGFNAAVRSNGTVWIWGWGAGSSIGDNVQPHRLVPELVPGLTNIVAIIVNSGAAMAIKDEGTVYGWGRNRNGSLGFSDEQANHITTPLKIPSLSNIVDVALSTDHGIALRSDGIIWTWGSNENGKLGRVTTETSFNSPGIVTGLNNIIGIAAGRSHSLALRSDGTVWAWGRNQEGQIGDGGFSDRFKPRQVKDLSNVFLISTGTDDSYALRSDGAVWAWGGRTPLYPQPIPTLVDDLPNIISVSGTGGSLAVGLSNSGEIWDIGTYRINSMAESIFEPDTIGFHSKRLVEPFTLGQMPEKLKATACQVFYFVAKGILDIPCVDASSSGFQPPLFDVEMTQLPNTLQFQLTSGTNIQASEINSTRNCLPTFENNILSMPCTIVMTASFGSKKPFDVDMNLISSNGGLTFEVKSAVPTE